MSSFFKAFNSLTVDFGQVSEISDLSNANSVANSKGLAKSYFINVFLFTFFFLDM